MPIDHHYEPRLPQIDVQQGDEVFPTSRLDLPEKPITPDSEVINQPIHSTTPETKNMTLDCIRRSSRTPKPKMILSMSAALNTTEPEQYRDAMTFVDSAKWKTAIQQECDSLIKNHTWELVPLPADRSLIGSRWTFRLKPGTQSM